MRPSAGHKERGSYRKARKQNYQDHVNIRLRRLLFEPLEERRLLAVVTWDWYYVYRAFRNRP